MSAPFWKSPLKLALAVSVLANLFFVSAIGARAFWSRSGGEARQIAETGSAELREAIAEIRSSRREAFRAKRAEIAQAREKIYEAIAADPFEPDALRTAQANVMSEFIEMRGFINESSVELVSRLGPEDRKKLAEYLRTRDEERMRRRERKRRD